MFLKQNIKQNQIFNNILIQSNMIQKIQSIWYGVAKLANKLLIQ